MSTFRSLAKTAALLLSVPLIGWASATRVAARLVMLCAVPLPETDTACAMGPSVALLRDASTGCALAALALLASIDLSARLCRGNAARLALLFGLQIRATLAMLAALVLVEGAILTYSVWAVERAVFHTFNIYLLGFLAIGTAAAGGAMLWSLATMDLRPVAEIVALPVGRTHQPRLWRLIDELARSIGARTPDHLLIGLAPSFHARMGRVRITGTKHMIAGETIHLSAPMLRLMTEGELAAILAHELAHFQAEDVRYSSRFLPIYRGLEGAIRRLTGRWSLWNLALTPTVAVLSFAHDRFALAERAISREREFTADAVAAKVTDGGRALVAGLAVFISLARTWPQIRDLAFNLLNQDRPLANICDSFAAHGRHLLDETAAAALIGQIASEHQSHPIDTHPTFAARAAALGIAPEAALAHRSGAASDLIDKLDALEAGLTRQYNRLLSGRLRPALA